MALEGIGASVLPGLEELAAFYVVFLSGLKDVSINSPVDKNTRSCSALETCYIVGMVCDICGSCQVSRPIIQG